MLIQRESLTGVINLFSNVTATFRDLVVSYTLARELVNLYHGYALPPICFFDSLVIDHGALHFYV